jgi:uncharacterized membrane protein
LIRSRGQSVLYAVLLMPTLMLILALAVDIAGMQMQTLRLRYAVDLATVAAANVVDGPFYTETGRLRIDQIGATAATREYLVRNLASVPDVGDATSVASGAEVAVVNRTPASNPYTGSQLDHPAVCARIRVPYRFSLLGWIGIRSVTLVVTASAEIRS